MNMRTLGVAACLIAVAACGKKDKNNNTGAPPTAKETTPATAKASASDLGPRLARLPGDASLLAAFNFQQLRSTKMYKQKPALFEGIAAGGLDTLVKRCNIRVFDQVDHVVIARGVGDEPAMYILVEGTFTQAAVEACIAKSQDIVHSESGGITTYAEGGLDKPLHVAWPAPSIALVVDDRKALAALLDKSTSPGPSATHTALMKNIDTSATAWAVGSVPADVPLAMLGIPAAPKVFWAHAIYGDGAKLLLGGRFDDADGAMGMKRVVEKWTKGGPEVPPSMQGVLKAIKLSASGTELVLRADMTATQIEAISNTAGAMP